MNLKFTKDHEWIAVVNNEATIGITDYAQQQLGDIVFVELPEIGLEIKSGEEVGVVESVKAASEFFTPISGKVKAVNKDLENDPSLINSSPESRGWIFKLEVSDADEMNNLMDELSYKEYLGSIK